MSLPTKVLKAIINQEPKSHDDSPNTTSFPTERGVKALNKIQGAHTSGDNTNSVFTY